MPRLTLPLLLCGLILSGCARQEIRPLPEQGQAAPPAQEAAVGADAPTTATAEAEEARLPAVPLTDELLFRFLLAEIAGQRGMLNLAKETYLDLARSTRDPRVVRRAAEIALYSRDQEAALELARMWLEIEPDSERALQTLVVMLISHGRVEEASPYLEKMLAADAATTFMQLPALFAKSRDTAAVHRVVKGLAQKYPQLAEGSTPWPRPRCRRDLPRRRWRRSGGPTISSPAGSRLRSCAPSSWPKAHAASRWRF